MLRSKTLEMLHHGTQAQNFLVTLRYNAMVRGEQRDASRICLFQMRCIVLLACRIGVSLDRARAVSAISFGW